MFENLPVPKLRLSSNIFALYIQRLNKRLNKFKIKQIAQALHVELIMTGFFLIKQLRTVIRRGVAQPHWSDLNEQPQQIEKLPVACIYYSWLPAKLQLVLRKALN